MKRFAFSAPALIMVAALAAFSTAAARAQTAQTGNVIFFHPDGAGVAHWNAHRYLTVGPDGEINWDKLPGMAVYLGHMKDSLTGTSHGGATTHAYGVRVEADSFGLDGDAPIVAASGKPMSVMKEAQAAGKAIGVVQTGHIGEPGTAAFLASTKSRRDVDEIAKQVIESGAQVIMAGGEKFLLPEGVAGRHGPGGRKDGLNLIKLAEELGYVVVYTKAELAALDLSKVEKLLGVFAHVNTFNDQTEERNLAEGKPHYAPDAPTIAEMAAAALSILSRDPDGFFLVAEEEGTDNMGNSNNAPGQLEALARADKAIGVFRDFVAANPNTLLLMAADSDAGGMQVLGPDPRYTKDYVKEIPWRDRNGAPLDGVEGPGSRAFLSAPDKAGKQWPFAIAWASREDVSGAILVRADGLNSGRVKGRMDNVDVYKLIYLTLFGVEIK